MSKYGNPSPLFLFWSKLVLPSLSQVQSGRRAFAESLDSDENFKHQHMLLCRDIGSLIHLRTFWESLAKEMFFFWVKNSVSWARSELFYGIYYILY